MIRPIVQSRGVKISARRPDERVNLPVELYLGELLRIPQWAKKFSLEHKFKVNCPSQPVFERDRQHIGSDLFEALDTVNWMFHAFNLAQGIYGCRTTALLQQLPIRQKLVLMQFCPCLHQALLPLRKASGKERNRSNAEDGGVLLIVGMEVRHVMSLGGLNKHSNDNAIKPTKLRHGGSVPSRDQERNNEGLTNEVRRAGPSGYELAERAPPASPAPIVSRGGCHCRDSLWKIRKLKTRFGFCLRLDRLG